MPSENVAPRGMCWVHSELVFHAASVRTPNIATLDLDATVIDSDKRVALPEYKGGGSCWAMRVVPMAGCHWPPRGRWRAAFM